MTRRVLAALLLLAATACGPSFVAGGSPLEAFVEAGARRVPADQRDDLLVGNTLVAEGVRVYYAPDGAKIIRLDDGTTLERRWHRRADGIMCEQLTVSGAELCADHGILYQRAGEFRAFRPDGTESALAFRIEPGAAWGSAEVDAEAEVPDGDPEVDRPEG